MIFERLHSIKNEFMSLRIENTNIKATLLFTVQKWKTNWRMSAE